MTRLCVFLSAVGVDDGNTPVGVVVDVNTPAGVGADLDASEGVVVDVNAPAGVAADLNASEGVAADVNAPAGVEADLDASEGVGATGFESNCWVDDMVDDMVGVLVKGAENEDGLDDVGLTDTLANMDRGISESFGTGTFFGNPPFPWVEEKVSFSLLLFPPRETDWEEELDLEFGTTENADADLGNDSALSFLILDKDMGGEEGEDTLSDFAEAALLVSDFSLPISESSSTPTAESSPTPTAESFLMLTAGSFPTIISESSPTITTHSPFNSALSSMVVWSFLVVLSSTGILCFSFCCFRFSTSFLTRSLSLSRSCRSFSSF